MLYHDKDTNKVYFSNLLEEECPNFSKSLFGILEKHDVRYQLISGTKSIWMRDYMPIQTKEGRFVRYVHEPKYLIEVEEERTVPREATGFLDQGKITDIDLNMDGGNVVRCEDKIICTEKIIEVNRPSRRSKQEIIDGLKSALQISEVILIPWQPYDRRYHSDGVVRFIDANKVLIPPYKEEDREFEKQLIDALRKHDLEIVTLPPRGYYKEGKGHWIPYINYMQVGGLIILPVVGDKADDEVVACFQENFPKCQIEDIDATEIIKEGGALNCISWNVHE